MGRTENTEKRRREILAAALHCFDAHGYEKTTLADIRDGARASIGSIYHHFQDKEQIFAALNLEAIAPTQAFSLGYRTSPRWGFGCRACGFAAR